MQLSRFDTKVSYFGVIQRKIPLLLCISGDLPYNLIKLMKQDSILLLIYLKLRNVNYEISTIFILFRWTNFIKTKQGRPC